MVLIYTSLQLSGGPREMHRTWTYVKSKNLDSFEQGKVISRLYKKGVQMTVKDI